MALNVQQTKLKATTAYVELQAAISAAQLAASAQYIKLKATTAYVQLQAAVAAAHITAETQYVLLQATTLVGHFVDFFNLEDSATLTDAQTFAIGKHLDDIAQAAEQISLAVSKSAADSTTVADSVAIIVAFVRDFSETVVTTDSATRDVGKALSDSVASSEATTVAFEKFLADVINPVDTITGINFTDAEDDAVVIDALGIDDDPVVAVGKVLADTSSATDSGVLLMQDYCDITYFLEDYVGQSRTF